jgi:hypothetical protein
LKRNSLYRDEVREAVRIFRPILQALKVRERNGHQPVYLAMFDELEGMNIDACSIQFAVGNIDALGIFLIKYTNQGLLRAYIILNQSLYNDQDKSIREIRKIAGVHEFIHFLATIYVASIVGSSSLRSVLLGRLQKNVDRLLGPNLIDLYFALSGTLDSKYTPPELTDKHFRLGCEGNTPDYEMLFYHFLFSRELFEFYFDTNLQLQFKELIAEGKQSEAIELIINALRTAADDKDVPFNTARNQLADWVHVYTR